MPWLMYWGRRQSYKTWKLRLRTINYSENNNDYNDDYNMYVHDNDNNYNSLYDNNNSYKSSNTIYNNLFKVILWYI